MKKFFAIALSTLFLFSATACSLSGNEGKGEVVTDLLGRTVALPEKVERVVCIGAGALRLYSYLGDMDKLVGVEDVDKEGTGVGTTLSLRPYQMANAKRFNSLPTCGMGGPTGSADAEKILSCNPDVIFSLYTSDVSAMDELEQKTGTPVVTLSYGTTEAFDENVKTSLTLMGEILGKEERAEAIVSYIDGIVEELGALSAKVKWEEKPTVYLGCQSNYGTHGIESSSANYSIFDVSGIRNVLDENGYQGYQKNVDLEALLVMNPDKIILDAGGLSILKSQYAKQERAEVFNAMKAFKTGEVYLQMPYNAYYTNLEIAYCDAYFDACIAYPEQMKSFDSIAKAREIITFFLGRDCYDELAEKLYGGFRKLNLAEHFPLYEEK
ncbi:MAG: iron ABC transporter substrate-binding protein [Clostridia bacterium]|nr:iron ABC transporter substrate-binding protein [Clostridia bacterium]